MSRSTLSALVRSLTLLASVGAPCLAHAADLLPPPPPEPLPPPIEVGGGWYLRGDVGVGVLDVGEIRTTLGKGYELPSGYTIDNHQFGEQFFAGAGVGYQFNGFLRGDITGEYRGGSGFSYVESFDNFDEYGNKSTGIDYHTGHLRSILVLANGYFDLGTWCGLTPYIGGGIGTAFHRVAGHVDIGAGSALGGFGSAKAQDTTSLAWAAHAGITYHVTPNFLVDVGYRFVDMGSVKSGPVVCVNSDACAAASYKFKDIISHDVRIGLRYLIGGGVVGAAPLPSLAPAYEPAPGPLVRKY